MVDLSIYAGQIASRDDRTLFQEAVVSAHAGALRGAYILIWIAAAESLKRKFREAAVRDGAANKLLGKITQQESQQKSADMIILTSAKEYGFIDEVAFQKLEYIYRMRCVYGHPYEAAPTEEELNSAVKVVVDLVLGMPTLLRHGFVQSTIEKLYSDISYLEDSEAAVRSFASEISAKIDPRVYSYLLEKYAEKLEATLDDPSLSLIIMRGLWFLSEFLLSIGTAFFSEAQWHDFVSHYSKVMQPVLLSDGRICNGIGQRAKDSLISYSFMNSKTHPSLLKRVEKLFEEELLSLGQAATLKGLSIATMKAAQLKLSTCYEAIISALKSHDWYTQNPAAGLVQLCYSEIVSLPSEKQQELGRNMLQAADGEARSAVRFFELMKSSSIVLPLDFVKGVAFECFVNERQEFRLKEDGLIVSIGIFKHYPDVVAELVQQVASSTVQDWVSSDSYADVLELIGKHTQLAPLFEVLTQNRARLRTSHIDT